MLRGAPWPVIGEWRPSAFSPTCAMTIRSLTLSAFRSRSGLRWERAKALLACEGPDARPWVAGLVMRKRDGWGFRQSGAILLGDASAIVRWRDGREEMEIEGVGRATLRTWGLAFVGRPRTEYSLESGESVVVHVPRIFSTSGLSRWQFGLVQHETNRLRIAAGALRKFEGTLIETVGREASDPGCLVSIDPAEFPVLIRATTLGSPLLAPAVARELLGAPESVRLLVMMAAIWERIRYDGSAD